MLLQNPFVRFLGVQLVAYTLFNLLNLEPLSQIGGALAPLAPWIALVVTSLTAALISRLLGEPLSRQFLQAGVLPLDTLRSLLDGAIFSALPWISVNAVLFLLAAMVFVLHYPTVWTRVPHYRSDPLVLSLLTTLVDKAIVANPARPIVLVAVGSGCGTVLLHVVSNLEPSKKEQLEAIGVELNIFLWAYARWRTLLVRQIRFICSSYQKVPLGN